ncbi:hypothetical protein ACFVFH_04635 [Streptomyces sp. NPDC057697]|uniref:hypothetical protein n=1 Tax=Streptomyces sp. NPDC057697 TaxID=3346219 RepID=UPI003689F342
MDDAADGGTDAGVPAADGATRTWAGSWPGRGGRVGEAEVEAEAEGAGVAESRVERVEETGALNSVWRAVNASQSRETDIAVPIPTVTVPMSSAGDCFRRLAECRAALRAEGAGRDGDVAGEGGTGGAGIPVRGAFSSKSSISAGRAP